MSMITHSPIVLKPKPIKKFGSRRQWELVEDVKIFHTESYSKEEYISIPKGEIFDGASIPRPLTSVLSPVGILFSASMLHDYGYKRKYVWYFKDGEWSKIHKDKNREFWDGLFYRMIIDTNHDINGIEKWAYTAWFAVRVGGWLAWIKNV